jgi:hypothetical protein
MGKINHEDTKTLRFSQEFNDGIAEKELIRTLFFCQILL